MVHKNKNLFFLFLLTICFSSCQKKKWVITNHSSTKIAIDNTISVDNTYLSFLEFYKEQMAAEMNVVIGQTEQAISVYRPESPLSNLSADIVRAAASSYLQKDVDMAVINIGGLRTDIPEGNITVGKIFELMPFENTLYIVWLKGDKLAELCDIFAIVGGEGVSGIKMGIKNGKAVDPTIGGKPIDREKIYIIATNDYLAGGNDKLTPLAESEKFVNTGLKIRDIFIEYINNETAKKKKINAQLDGRIYEIN